MAQLPSPSQFGDYGDWPGRDVLDSGGSRLGSVREIYLDRETGRPEWVLVEVAGGEARFVPLAGASVEAETIRVAFDAETVTGAPGLGADPRIGQAEELALHEHYGLGAPPEPPTREHERPPTGPTPTAWGAPEGGWSAAADPSMAPPPAAPPSPEELEAAAIREPPASTERAEAAEEVAAAEEEAAVAEEIAEEEAAAEEEEAAAADEAAEEEPPVAPEPPEPPRQAAWTPPPPPAEEAGGGALAVITARKRGIIAGVTVVAVLVFILRRRR
ncbi:MAG TPA: PRC-barrel domain-containing protein [Solirubrobacter sp.]|nr:PRC-barrel domain-containing protein [Solirubrobacter sp.]